MVSIHMVRKGTASFSNIKSITLRTLKLVDYVQGLAVSKVSNGVTEISARAGERVDGMVNVTSLSSGFIAGSGACGAETCVNSELAEIGGGVFVKEVMS